MKTGVILARFQPIHNGHLQLIKKACDENEQVLVIIGSIDKLSKRNPIPWTIRKQLVEKAIKKVNEIIDRFKISSKSRDKHQMIYGTILHIDGDKEYLNSCMDLYKEMNIFANGIYLKESEIKDKIEELVLMLTPDIVVITGHDLYNGKGFKELSNYRNTKHFMDAVRMIRKHFNSESITIIVGACGSNFEALIASGANFSSSPKRINIHTYDPAVIAIKVATTSINQTVDFGQVLKYIENKKDAFGGIETKGKMKVLL